jgi:hypothetical protein
MSCATQKLSCKTSCKTNLLTHSQLLEGLKCESQTENNGRTKSHSTLFGSHHYRGVEGRVGTLGWD